MKVIRKGSKGRHVKNLQEKLGFKGDEVDGIFGPATERTVIEKQKALGLKTDGIVGPITWSTFYKQLPVADSLQLTIGQLNSIFGRVDQTTLMKFLPGLNACFKRYNINTPLRVAHFLGQIGHESGEFRYTEEIASGRAYEGREDLGNTVPGDGVRFKGRGLIQITGRTNYDQYSRFTGYDFIADPQMIADDPHYSVDVAGWFWTARSLNHFADQDDIRKLTRRINGGYNGIDHRIELTDRAKSVLL